MTTYDGRFSFQLFPLFQGNDSSFATEMSKIHANSINVPQLAALVKERNGIWNRKHTFYRKRKYWNQAWLEIAKEMFPHYDQMSFGEQIETGKKPNELFDQNKSSVVGIGENYRSSLSQE